MFLSVPGLSRPLGTSADLAGILLATLLWSLSQRSHSYGKDTNQCENQESRPENPPQRPSPLGSPNRNRLPKECWVGACVPHFWKLGRKRLGGDNLALALLPREHTVRWILPHDCIPVRPYTHHCEARRWNRILSCRMFNSHSQPPAWHSQVRQKG